MPCSEHNGNVNINAALMWGWDPAARNWIKDCFYTPASGKGLGGLDADARPGWVPTALCPFLEGSPRVRASQPRFTGGQHGWAFHQQQKQGKVAPSEPVVFSHLLIRTKDGCFHSGLLQRKDKPLESSQEQLWELLVPAIQVSFLFPSFALLHSWRAELSMGFFPH